MHNTIFRPVYTIKGLLDVLIISLLLLLSLSFAFLKMGINITIMLNLIYLGIFCAWWLHSLIRQIIFTSSNFSVERYIWPSKTIEYSDVIDIGMMAIKTKKGKISLAAMSNRTELVHQFRELIEQGKISKTQLENKVAIEETIHLRSILPTMLISFLLWCILFLFWPYYHSSFSTPVIWLISILILVFVYSIVYRVRKKQLEKLTKAAKTTSENNE